MTSALPPATAWANPFIAPTSRACLSGGRLPAMALAFSQMAFQAAGICSAGRLGTAAAEAGPGAGGCGWAVGGGPSGVPPGAP